MTDIIKQHLGLVADISAQDVDLGGGLLGGAVAGVGGGATPGASDCAQLLVYQPALRTTLAPSQRSARALVGAVLGQSADDPAHAAPPHVGGAEAVDRQTVLEVVAAVMGRHECNVPRNAANRPHISIWVQAPNILRCRPLDSWTLAFFPQQAMAVFPPPIIYTANYIPMRLDMERIEKTRRLAADPFWEEVKDQIYHDTHTGRKEFRNGAFMELKCLLCVKSAWDDYTGGKDGLFGATSLQCDKQWHTFLLNTENYQLMCRRILGNFIHHRPVWHRASSDRLTGNARTALRLIFDLEWNGKTKHAQSHVVKPPCSGYETESEKTKSDKNTHSYPTISDVGKYPVDINPAKRMKLSSSQHIDEIFMTGGHDPSGPGGGRNDDSGESDSDEEEEFFNCG